LHENYIKKKTIGRVNINSDNEKIFGRDNATGSIPSPFNNLVFATKQVD
jgi:hypothetical protein